MFSPEKRQAFLRAGQTRSLLWLCLLCFMPPFAPVWLEEGEEEARLCHALRPSVGPRASRAPPCPAETALGPGGVGAELRGGARGPRPEVCGRPAARSRVLPGRRSLSGGLCLGLRCQAAGPALQGTGELPRSRPAHVGQPASPRGSGPRSSAASPAGLEVLLPDPRPPVLRHGVRQRRRGRAWPQRAMPAAVAARPAPP